MYITAILLFFLLICFFISERKDYKGLYSFDKATTLPLRGLLALLILSTHLGQKTDIYPLSNFTAVVGSPIVSVFFFISGYGLCVSYLTKGDAYIDNFLTKRLGKLLPKFTLLTLVMIIFYHFSCENTLDIQLSKFYNEGWTPLPYSWFIYAIIYVYFSFYVCSIFVRKPDRIGILFTLSIFLYIGILSKILYFPRHWYITISCVNLGYFIAYYEKRITNIIENHGIIFFTSLAIILLSSLIAMMKTNYGIILEIRMMSLAITIYVIIRTLGFFQWRWLCQVGIFSLELYLIHGIPLTIGQHIGLENWSLWFFTYGLSILSAIAINHIFNVAHKSKQYKLKLKQ